MNRFFRTALFPLIVIVLLVYLASQTLLPKSKPAQKTTYSEAIAKVKASPSEIAGVVFSPSSNGTGSITMELKDTKDKIKVNYPSPQSLQQFQTLLIAKGVTFDSKKPHSSPWWSLLGTLLPLLLLFGF